VTSSERLGPVQTSHGRIAVLARRPPENRDVFCDFVASRGREGPLSILATFGLQRELRHASARSLGQCFRIPPAVVIPPGADIPPRP
jgi:hypothetical protein